MLEIVVLFLSIKGEQEGETFVGGNSQGKMGRLARRGGSQSRQREQFPPHPAFLRCN